MSSKALFLFLFFYFIFYTRQGMLLHCLDKKQEWPVTKWVRSLSVLTKTLPRSTLHTIHLLCLMSICQSGHNTVLWLAKCIFIWFYNGALTVA